MTALQQLWLASALGAVTFFAVGALVAILHLRGRASKQKSHEARAAMEERLAQVDHQHAARATQLIEASSEVEVERLRAQGRPEALAELSIETSIDAVEDAAARPHNIKSHPTGSITEALSGAIACFSDPKMRCAAVVDEVGFLVSSYGDGGVELAGYAAMLNDAAHRAAQFLPFAAPALIELIDAQGSRISVWPFHADDTPLLLVKLGIGATDERRVQRVLSEVIRILTPLPHVAPGAS